MEQARLSNALGIKVWQPRSSKKIRCAVFCPEILNHDQQKILNGMISVLGLPSDEIKITSQVNELEELCPDYVLCLGEANNLSCSVITTYSPKQLEVDPKLKRKAFNVLLELKKKLHD